MNIYLAARYGRLTEMQRYAADLADLGHQVTSRWISGDHDIRAQGAADEDAWQPIWAQEDWADLLEADCCIAFTEPPGEVPGRARGGRHVEFGAALALGHQLFVVGYRENIFHWWPEVIYCATWQACLTRLITAVTT